MKTNNRVKTIPNGEKIKGSNLLSKYVSKNKLLIYFNEMILSIQEYVYFNKPKLYKLIKTYTNNRDLIA